MTNPLTEKLLALAVKHTDLKKDEIVALVNSPQWPPAVGSGWQGFVPLCIQEAWGGMSPDARLGVVVVTAVADMYDDGGSP
jgi:hypothetical protein